MAQSSYTIANSSGAVFRARVNELTAAIQSSNSGATAPSSPVAGMLWLDTSVSPPVLRHRNGANDAWLVVPSGLGSAATDFLAAADAAAQRTTLGLGSAAVLTAGTAANNAVQLDGDAKLPAVDGSQLTGLPSGASATANINGGGTATLVKSSGISSMDDLGTGRYRLNFSTAMPDTNYTIVYGGGAFRVRTTEKLTTSVTIVTESATGAATDYAEIYIAIFA